MDPCRLCDHTAVWHNGFVESRLDRRLSNPRPIRLQIADPEGWLKGVKGGGESADGIWDIFGGRKYPNSVEIPQPFEYGTVNLDIIPKLLQSDLCASIRCLLNFGSFDNLH